MLLKKRGTTMDKVCVICGKIYPSYGMSTVSGEECRKIYKKRNYSRAEVQERKRETAKRFYENKKKMLNDARAAKIARNISMAEKKARKEGMSYGQAEAVKYMQISNDELKHREELKKRIAESKQIPDTKCRCVKCYRQIDIGSRFCKHCGSIQLVRKVD